MSGDVTILFDQRWVGPHGIGRFAAELFARVPGVEPVPTTLKPLHPLDPLWLSRIIARRRPDVFFTPGFNPPVSCTVPFVFVLHDLIPISFSGETTLAKKLYFELLVRPACHRAHRVLTVSEFSRREIIAWSGIPADKVVNVSNGVSPVFSPSGPVKELGRPYFLFVGNHKPHKNLRRVLEAFARSGLSPAVSLVVTGAPWPELVRLVASLGIEGSVNFAGEIPEAELAAWYRGAVALVFPTLYEGFGLPALEAMACGTPVISSGVTSLHEVVGDNAVIVDPCDCGMIAAAMRTMSADGELRQRLSAGGVARARLFDWDRTAEAVHSVLLSACSRPVNGRS